MSDENHTSDASAAQATALPVSGRSAKAFLTDDGKTMLLEIDLTGQGVPSSSGKTDVIATASIRNIVSAGRIVSFSGSCYVKKA